MIYYADIEADSLLDDATKVHCLSYLAGGSKPITLVEDLQTFFKGVLQDDDTIVLHNGLGYDLPLLQRLGYIDDFSVLPDYIIVDNEVKNVQIIDTLAMSRHWYPDLNGHGLFDYARRLNGVKPVVEDWKDQPIEVYVQRCEADTILTEQVFEYLCEKLEIKI